MGGGKVSGHYRDLTFGICLQMAEAPEVASLVTVISVKTQQREYLKDIREHRFVWCPPGNGLDT